MGPYINLALILIFGVISSMVPFEWKYIFGYIAGTVITFLVIYFEEHKDD